MERRRLRKSELCAMDKLDCMSRVLQSIFKGVCFTLRVHSPNWKRGKMTDGVKVNITRRGGTGVWYVFSSSFTRTLV